MRKTLKIAQIAPLWYPVPPRGYGGTEAIVSKLTEELIKRGHDVTLFASGDSKTKAKLISVIKKNLFSQKVPWFCDSYNILNLITAFSRAREFDIIHSHIDVYDPIFRAKSPVPTISTLHNPFWPKGRKTGKWYEYQARVLIYNKFRKLPYVAISNSYRKQCPAKIKFVETIYHGVDLNQLKFKPNPENYFIWLGRLTPKKGLHLVVKLARELGFRLLIAGKVASTENEKYFQKEIKPYLSKKIQFLSEVRSEKEKSELLGRAKALIYPLLWEEPFGIVMIESMACGAPVIAFPRGAAPELIKDGENGFLVKNLKGMKKAIKNIEKISRNKCRQRVEKLFTVEKMTEEYEKVYYQIIKDFTQKTPLY